MIAANTIRLTMIWRYRYERDHTKNKAGITKMTIKNLQKKGSHTSVITKPDALGTEPNSINRQRLCRNKAAALPFGQRIHFMTMGG